MSTDETIPEFNHQRLHELTLRYNTNPDSVDQLERDELLRLQREKILRLSSAIEVLRKYASDTWDHWDASTDHKVGKRLKSLAGEMPGYNVDVTSALSEANLGPR